jgi:V/A-type H+-transporting ATPase subunit A
VSPPGGDISEPVSQATLRIVKVFWGLDSSLAYRRHFPAINWLTSYSLYQEKVDRWADENVEADFSAQRTEAMRLLQTEAELQEIVQLVGVDALSHSDRLILEISRSIREDFLHQNSFHEVDTYTSLHKQYRMLKLIMTLYKEAGDAIKQGVTIQKISKMDVIERIGRAKYVEEINVDKSYDEIEAEIRKEVAELIRKGADEV